MLDNVDRPISGPDITLDDVQLSLIHTSESNLINAHCAYTRNTVCGPFANYQAFPPQSDSVTMIFCLVIATTFSFTFEVLNNIILSLLLSVKGQSFVGQVSVP